ncbi:MAG TPA: hypothetical protein VJU58_13730 [Microbacterium sp.]|nr:hypothetical protein [Microbacterium sp.]
MTAAQLTALVVLVALGESLGSALACASSDSDPSLILVAAGNNAAQTIAFLAEF